MSRPTTTPERDACDLAGFGYRQKLDRTLGSFSAFAASFSYLSVLTGSSQLFHMGYAAGGPAFFWTWPAVFAGQLLVALCFAELAARYPLSGGVYQWSKLVGSGSSGWMAGWVYLACAVITLAATALRSQTTLPQLAPWFQFIGRPDDRLAAVPQRRAAGRGPRRFHHAHQCVRRAAAGADQQCRRGRRAAGRAGSDRPAGLARPPRAGGGLRRAGRMATAPRSASRPARRWRPR